MGIFALKKRSGPALAVQKPPESSGDAVLGGLGAPPFGMGFHREVDGLLRSATGAGHTYRRFRYRYRGGLDRFDAPVLVVDLPFRLPDMFWSTSARPRAGVLATRPGLLQDSRVRLWARDEELAKAVFRAVAGVTVELAMHSLGPADFSVEGNQLVVVDPPPGGLEVYLELIDELIGELAAVAPSFAQPSPVREGFRFYGHPDWNYSVEGDRSLLRAYGLHARHQSRVEDVITAESNGIRLMAFRHTWLSDAVTRAQIPRTVSLESDCEQRALCAFDLLGARIPDLSLNGELIGEPVLIGTTRFTEAFTLRSTDPQQAYQLFNDQVRDHLLATRPYGWTVRKGRVTCHVPVHDPIVIGECQRALYDWIDRLPRQLREVMGLPAVLHER